MKIRFWGVRGSIPAPGPETVRYGGNTSCVSISTDADYLFILDMGTGLMKLGHELMSDAFGRGEGSATILLTHAHWDHIQGFPFFPPIFVPGNEFRLFGNARSPRALEAILEGQMDPHFSPIHTLKNLGAKIEFAVVKPGTCVEEQGAVICAAANPHGSVTALAFRIEEGEKKVVYAPDAGYPDGAVPPASADLYRDADVLIHDCTYTPEDQMTRLGRGQSSLVDAARTAADAGARNLVLFHYDQDYADDQVDALLERTAAELERLGATTKVSAAREGLEIDV